MLASTEVVEVSKRVADNAGLLAEHSEVVRVLRRRSVGAEPVMHQLAIIDREDRRAQRGDDLQLIRRIIDRAQHSQQLVHLARSVDQRAALHPVWDACLTQAVLEHAKARATANQHRDIAIARRPVAGPVADHPWVVADDALHECGDVGSLGPRHVLRGLVLDFCPSRHAEQDNAGPVA